MKYSYIPYIERVTVIDTQSNHALTIVQLAGTESGYPDLLPFAPAYEKGIVSITEKIEQGSVPELVAENKSDQYVLLLEGEMLLGAKQNRTLNSSILLRPRSKTIIPVSCVERGRWSYKRTDFTPAPMMVCREVRSVIQTSVANSLREERIFRSDQSKVWDEVEVSLDSIGVRSSTSSFNDAYERKSADIDDRLRNFRKADNAVGVASYINGKMVGCDIVPSPEIFAYYFERILRSCILDALHVHKSPEGEYVNYQEKTKGFLRTIKEANLIESQSPGLGTDIRIEGERVIGSALVFDSTVIHSALFAR